MKFSCQNDSQLSFLNGQLLICVFLIIPIFKKTISKSAACKIPCQENKFRKMLQSQKTESAFVKIRVEPLLSNFYDCFCWISKLFQMAVVAFCNETLQMSFQLALTLLLESFNSHTLSNHSWQEKQFLTEVTIATLFLSENPLKIEIGSHLSSC